MFVRVRISSERVTETEKELTAFAGFDPVREGKWLVWKFSSRDVGDLFWVNAKATVGVVNAEMVN